MLMSRKKTYLFAAICYVICIIANLISRLSWIKYYSIQQFVPYILWIALAVTLFINKRNVFIYSAGACALWNLYGSIMSGFRFDYLFSFLAYACLTSLVVLAIKKNSIAKKIWYLPCILFLIGQLILWINWGYFSYLASSWLWILLDIVEAIAVALVGIWNKEFSIPEMAGDNNVFSTAVMPTTQFDPATSKFGGADKIKMYKELLDSGVITQDEFDAKKKQILGL